MLRYHAQVYFIGMEAKKRVVNKSMENNNFGFDDEQSLYIHVYHDHVAYRYEILKVKQHICDFVAVWFCIFLRPFSLDFITVGH